MATIPARTQTVRYPLIPRTLTVREAQDITPRMPRVTLTGDDLEGFQSQAPTDHIKLFFPRPEQTDPIMPSMGPDGMRPMPDDSPKPISRDDTVRAFRSDANELDVDFVHTPEEDSSMTGPPAERAVA